MYSRKEMLKVIASLPLLGGLAGSSLTREVSRFDRRSNYRRDLFNELGVRKLINGRGTLTTLTGSVMEPEVMEAMDYASRYFVDLIDLNEKVGERIAEMLNCEDAMVSAGAASALTLATAATITGTDREKIRSIPDFDGPRPEVLMPRTHRIYEQQFTVTGARLIEVEGPDEMRAAINENTVMLFYFNNAPERSVSREEMVAIGKEHGIVTFNDCASEVPPKENLFKYIEMGFDLVTFSGGKGIKGPQSAGLLFGRKDLIQAARLNHSPYGSIGRGMKVDKEEVIGMMIALELYLARDHEAERAMWDSWAEQMVESVEVLPSVRTRVAVHAENNQIPRIWISWDPAVIQAEPQEIVEKLRRGHPSIEANRESEGISYRLGRIQPDEIGIVIRRTRAVLEEAIA